MTIAKPPPQSTKNVPKRAKAFQQVVHEGREGWLYEWNTGAISLVFPPESFCFDVRKSRPLGVPPIGN